ncbi:MAG: Atu1372/SO_1960 family protein, partial [Shewanella algae]
MMHDTPEQRLNALGMSLPRVASALGNYEPVVISGHQLLTSGQFPFEDGKIKYQGRLGVDLELSDGYAACQLAALNAIAQLQQALGNLSRI